MTYTGFTITDGQLGNWQFHNARVYLTFKGDTNNARFIQPPNPYGGSVAVRVFCVGPAGGVLASAMEAPATIVQANCAPVIWGELVKEFGLGEDGPMVNRG